MLEHGANQVTQDDPRGLLALFLVELHGQDPCDLPGGLVGVLVQLGVPVHRAVAADLRRVDPRLIEHLTRPGVEQ